MQPMIFVGGAPRSGTTVTHALLCTSDRTNAFHPEISFVRPLFNAYSVGMQNWTPPYLAGACSTPMLFVSQ